MEMSSPPVPGTLWSSVCKVPAVLLRNETFVSIALLLAASPPQLSQGFGVSNQNLQAILGPVQGREPLL